jgi:hypothetical protein
MESSNHNLVKNNARNITIKEQENIDLVVCANPSIFKYTLTFSMNINHLPLFFLICKDLVYISRQNTLLHKRAIKSIILHKEMYFG